MPFKPCLKHLASFVAIGGAVFAMNSAAATFPSSRATLLGSHRPASVTARPVPAGTTIQGVTLLLKRPIEKEEGLRVLMEQQHNPHSKNYRKWLTADEYGEAFGPSQSDVRIVLEWARQNGLSVTTVSKSRRRVVMEGDADRIEKAFAAPLHALSDGKRALVDFSAAPSVPASLAGLVEGVATSPPVPVGQTRSDLKRSNVKEAFGPKSGAIAPQLTMPYSGSIYTLVTPHDFSHIYNADSLWSQGITGAGQTIAVVSRQDVRDDDWLSFRSLWGMPQVALNRVHPGNCQAPTLAGKTIYDILEPTVDVEWAGAAAPGATIELASCADVIDTNGNLAFDGVSTAVRNLVDSPTPPDIISFSYATCEKDVIGTNFADSNEVWTQAAAEGIAVVVSAGDQGASMCYGNPSLAIYGLGVNAYAASPHVVAVGGTEFSDDYKDVISQYWDVAVGGTGANGYESALSYIPEMAWNETCMSPQYYERYAGDFASREKLCNTGFAVPYPYAGGGGASQLIARPAWQSGVLGLPSGTTRVIPDVALFSADSEVWHHGLVFCLTDPSEINPGCENNLYWGGGTSFAAPAYAGIQALINQRIGGRQGTPAYSLYQIGRLQYNGAGTGYGSAATCNSELGTGSVSGCVFHDVTLGETTMPCFLGTQDCYAGAAVAQIGRLSSDGTGSPAYAATAGWDYATGLGSVNVANLVAAVAAVDAFASTAHTAGDTNGDRYADLTVNDPTRGVVGILTLQSGRLQNARYENIPSGSSVKALGDVNADGSADLLVVDGSGFVTAWLSEGQGEFNKLPLGAIPSGSRLVGTGDFDGNGYDDLVFDNSAAGTATVWLMTGLSSQTLTRNIGVGTKVAGVGDLDGDGLADLALASAGGQMSALLSLPGNSTRAVSLGAAPAGATPLGAADIDGSGTSDLVFFNAQSLTVTSWLMSDSASVSSTSTLSLPSGSTVLSLLDLDATMKSAVLVKDDNDVVQAFRRDSTGAWDVGTRMSTSNHSWLKPGASIVPNQGTY
jgi:hypothetical protein